MIQGLILALGAPLGWLLIQIARGATIRHEFESSCWLYLYMFGASAIAFSLFGAFGGHREDRLAHLATTDSLTGLSNSRYFQQRLREAVGTARRGEASIGLILLDIDRFKKVNDRLGHPVGDRVLESVGVAIRREARAGETGARIGGEEFALVLPGADSDETRDAAERIRQAVSREVARAGILPEGWALTLSAGIAMAPSRSRVSAETLFSSADRALYRAKESGRDCVVEGRAPEDSPPLSSRPVNSGREAP